MSRAGTVLVALSSWAPLLAVLVLAGFAIGWWATALGVAVLAAVAMFAVRAKRQVRDRPPLDPVALREELIELDRRSAPWIKAWTSSLLALTVVVVVLALVIAFEMR
jgi:hypothetical protein